ncbi:hypothetical protein AB1Y20_008780 [Prymnesium parvum]
MDAQPFAEDQPSRMSQLGNLVRGLNHPVTAFFHLFFKALAILAYVFGGVFNVGFVNLFIVCILLLAFDFWTVKNVSGRLMVGLRWWSEVQEDGSTLWRYEAHEDPQGSSFDYWVFWGGLFAPALIWSLFGIGSILRFSFDWLLLILTALSLSGANIIGYLKCKKDATSQITAGMQSVAARTGMNAAMGSVMQSAAGKAFGFA